MDTGRGALYTGVYWGVSGKDSLGGSWGGIAWGEMPDVGEGEEGSKSHCHLCTYATILHLLHKYPKPKTAIKRIIFMEMNYYANFLEIYNRAPATTKML